ncbi:hypothetical protein B0293_23850 [Amycolatopsis azurea DSM 43854]|uniref:Uncharacterized protein n=2 Tax=Amycolatopsis azurea TaxID=36819 RepID=M2PTU6_9PSEU|nr:hypothetical protein C791_7930 [Amycolatopsis azurea DSM 43854]OOC04323.1 hypothetical protein B0293_23850 [Amycolatopsis azurea DSM 43854]
MPTQREERDRLTLKRIGELADEWRAVARGLPVWRRDDTAEGGEPGDIVFRSTDFNAPCITVHGMWAPNIARYLEAVDMYAAVSLAELLWRIGGHGGRDDITQQTVHLLQTLGLEQHEVRHRRSR